MLRGRWLVVSGVLSVAEDVVLRKRPLVSARVEFEVSGAELDPVWHTTTGNQVSTDTERGTVNGRESGLTGDSLGVSSGGVVPAHELSVDPATGPLFNPADPLRPYGFVRQVVRSLSLI